MASVIDRIEHYGLSGEVLQARKELARLKAKLNIVPAIQMPCDYTPRLRQTVKTAERVEDAAAMVNRIRNAWRRK